MKSSGSSKETLWRSVYDKLIQEFKHFKHGDKFFSHEEICRNFNVSHITARRVISELTGNSFIKPIPRKGSIVTRSVSNVTIHFAINGLYIDNSDISNGTVLGKSFSAIKEEAAKLGLTTVSISADLIPIFCAQDYAYDKAFVLNEYIPLEYIELLKSRKYPFVCLRPPKIHPDLPSVCTSAIKGSEAMLQILIEYGHSRIAFMCRELTSPYQLPRFLQYQKVLESNGIHFDWQLVKEVSSERTSDFKRVMEELLTLPEPPTALITSSDHFALNVLKYCQENKIRVPCDLSIAGYNNIRETTLTVPQLSTIESRIDLAASTAVKMLVKYIISEQTPEPIIETIPSEFILRNSICKINKSNKPK